ncbi:unnamed protein product [Soboliphyme baturini]|uniref:RNase_PH domain-containing protein n=1 Tax=Soboliphyme baturini TaxID=241478 RepID=A0A183IPQ2_9BILA|nr:unnamed protein product [Soboliphyme baturini]
MVQSSYVTIIIRNGVQRIPKLSHGNSTIEEVLQDKYLGTVISTNGNCEQDLNGRIVLASFIFKSRTTVCTHRGIAVATKTRLYWRTVRTSFLEDTSDDLIMLRIRQTFHLLTSAMRRAASMCVTANMLKTIELAVM